MPTGYTREQIERMERLLLEAAQRSPEVEDIGKVPVPPSIATATIPNTGTMVNFGGGKGNDNIVLLTPLIALELAQALIAAGKENGWWDPNGNLVPMPS